MLKAVAKHQPKDANRPEEMSDAGLLRGVEKLDLHLVAHLHLRATAGACVAACHHEPLAPSFEDVAATRTGMAEHGIGKAMGQSHPGVLTETPPIAGLWRFTMRTFETAMMS